MSASTAVLLEGLRELARDPEALAEARPALRLILGLDRSEPVALEPLTAAAERLGCHPGTVKRWCCEGRMPGALKAGAVWRVPTDSVPLPAGAAAEEARRAPRRPAPARRATTGEKSSAENAMEALLSGKVNGVTTTPRSGPGGTPMPRDPAQTRRTRMDTQDATAKGGATVTPIARGTR